MIDITNTGESLSDDQKDLLSDRLEKAVSGFINENLTEKFVKMIQSESDCVLFAAEDKKDITPEQRKANRIVFAIDLDNPKGPSLVYRLVEPGDTRVVLTDDCYCKGHVKVRAWKDDPVELALQHSIRLADVDRLGLEWVGESR